ncbi:GGDEF domain-containing protein [Rhodococcus sovatensis]|uniref:GGDEF domain-containing protein n=1 Tax=Rhodococcus sovatensis TaxID=1805840 RepID=A0ABZ2PUV7_9NOCA
MNALREWWSQPTDYTWNVAYAQSHPILRRTKVAIGVCCWAYGLVCVLALITPVLSPGWLPPAVVGVFALSTVVVGFRWVCRPWPTYRGSLMFIAYAEVGVTSVLIALEDPQVAMLCAALLGVVGNYLAGFHNTTVFVAHQVWALATCGVLYAQSLLYTDVPAGQSTAYLIVLVMVLVTSPVLTQAYLTFLRRDAVVAHFDPLTGLRNRRGLESAVDSLFDDVSTIAVLVADLDNFKSVNDNFGHSFGDDVLRGTAETLNRFFPAPAITARTGGEEFVVVTTDSLDKASIAAEQLRQQIPECNTAGHTTTSIGIHYRSVVSQPISALLGELLDSADAAMYEAKRRGGNSVVIDNTDDEVRFTS